MNLIPKIAEALDIGLDEPFEISTRDGYKICRFFVRGNGVAYLEKYNKDFNQWTQENTDEIGKIVVGAYLVRKLPFEPKYGEIYYSVMKFIAVPGLKDRETDAMKVITNKWCNSTDDFMRKYCGNCFRTSEEAEKHKYEIYEKLTGRKWEEKCED